MAESAFLFVPVLFCAAGCDNALDAQLLSTYQAAQTSFEQAKSIDDYLRSAALYQEIRESGIVNGALLYNQGNAYMRAGQRGRAIVCYREALRYRPRDPYIKANLQFALGSNTPIRRRHGILDFVLFWKDWLSYRGKFQFTAVVGALAFVLGVIARHQTNRRLFSHLAWLALFVTTLSGLSAAYDWYRFDKLQHGVIITNEVVARKGNSKTYTSAFSEPLTEGTEFQLVERRGSWLLIGIENIGKGWVPEDTVETY